MSQQVSMAVALSCVGQVPAIALSLAQAAGMRIRTIKVDGQGMMKTNDARLDRINLEIENGIVTKATLG